MKKFQFILLITFHVLITNFSSAQQSNEAIIRRLENAEREAILMGDTSKLYQLMSFNIVVQNPENAIVGFRQIIDRVKTGKISYVSFERLIEKITFFNNTSTVMGKEVIVPRYNTECRENDYKKIYQYLDERKEYLEINSQAGNNCFD